MAFNFKLNIMTENLNKEDCINVLSNNYLGYLAYIHEKKPFVIPITFFFNKKDNTIISYSNKGHKINAMNINKNVSLQVSKINAADNWESVLAQGEFETLEKNEANKSLHVFSNGIKEIIFRNEDKRIYFIGDFSSKKNKEELPIVFIIKVNKLTGRKRVN